MKQFEIQNLVLLLLHFNNDQANPWFLVFVIYIRLKGRSADIVELQYLTGMTLLIT